MSRFKQDYYEQILDFYLVWSWSPRWRRYINTHKYYNEQEARLTCRKYRK